MRWSVLITLGLCWLATRRPLDANEKAAKSATGEWETPREGFAYGPLGRVLAGSIVVYHLTGLAAWMLPEKDSMGTFRYEARAPFEWWIKTTHTTQSWSMFAPNPPKSNLFMKVLVYDEEGEAWDLNTDVYACFDEDSTPEICESVFPIPWLTYTRQRKINRRVAGSEGGHGAWYQKWHARWVCREWAREHDGKEPHKVELIKVTYPIPSPEETAKNGPYDPRTQYLETHKEKVIYTARCGLTPLGKLNNDQRERFGFEPIDEFEYVGWAKERCKSWNKRLAREAVAEGRDPESAKVECGDPTVYEAVRKEQEAYKAAKKKAARLEREAAKKP
jgi:hypothetical protein